MKKKASCQALGETLQWPHRYLIVVEEGLDALQVRERRAVVRIVEHAAGIQLVVAADVPVAVCA